MLLDDGHQEFMLKLKPYIYLEVLLAALSRDRKQLSHLKMADIYGWLIDQAMDRILKDMTELRRYFRRSPGAIIEIKQEPEYRHVAYKYKGYRQEVKFLNEWIKVECGEILKGVSSPSGMIEVFTIFLSIVPLLDLSRTYSYRNIS